MHKGVFDRDDGPSPSTGLLQRASRFFTMPQMPFSSTNVTLLNKARNFEVHGHAHLMNAYNLNVVNTYGGNHGLDIMAPSVSFGALHDSYTDDPEHRCGPGIHSYVLKRLHDWIDDVTSTERVFWFHGSAGSGKSAIAHTIADLYGQDKVAATFFFCRSDTDRNNGNRLFMTLAWQLALSIPSIQNHIIQSLNRNPGLPLRSVETQFKELIAQPFQAIVHNATSKAQLPSLVVVIDGIDECTDEKLQRRILGVIGNAASNIHVPLRFLISSRLEAHIQKAFDQFKCPILCIDLRLEGLEELVSFDAIHNSRGQSLVRPASLENTLRQLQGWVDNPTGVERICWLQGLAGSGKSAMAQAIVDSNERRKVVATFFFHESDATRNDGSRLFPTLSWQFASSISTYKDYIIQYLADCPYLSSQTIERQFEELVVQPFRVLKVVASPEQPIDPVVIIDGVDECVDLGIQRRFLELIGNAVKTRRVSLRFLISSRSGGHIQETINCFQCPVLGIDLGIVKGPDYDIQQPYSNKGFSRVLSGPSRDGRVAGDGSLASGTTIFLVSLVRPLINPAFDKGTSAKPKYDHQTDAEEDYCYIDDDEEYCYIDVEEYSCYEAASSESLAESLIQSPFGMSHRFGTPDFDYGTGADIEEYLNAEFSRIATEQKLGETWPGQQVIQDFAHKSSGYFIYADTIIKLIDEEGSNAERQLNLIRNLQPRTETTFGHLDELYSEILKWQPDQVFLKNVLALLVVRTSLLEYCEDLWEDDVMLMNVSDQEMQSKLCRMHSLLQLEPCTDVHHQSFLDFLQDASRSGQYYISKEEGSRQCLKLITGSLVQYVNEVLNQPQYHGHHFAPRFSQVIKKYPRTFELPVAEWQKVLRPLLKLGHKFYISCAKCTTVRIIRDLLLHLAFLCGISSIRSRELAVDEVEEFEGHPDDATAIDDSLYNCLSPLLAHLRSPTSQSGPTETEIKTQICTILCFDCADIATRIHFVSDAQNLVDVIVEMLDEKFFLNQGGPDVNRKAILLVLEIYARIPVLPRSLFFGGDARPDFEKWNCRSSEIEILCQSALIGKILDSKYIVPVSRVCEQDRKFILVGGNEYKRSMPLGQWRRRENPTVKTTIQVMLGVAKVFRYLHSMGIILHYGINSDDILLDSNLSTKIRFFGSFLLYIVKTPSICLEEHSKVLMTRETNVFNFGCLFYEMAFSVEIPYEDRIQFKRNIIDNRPIKPEIPNNVWKLIQLCCGKDPKRRPTMYEVVGEMKTWSLPPLPDA